MTSYNLNQCTPTQEQTWLLQTAVLSGEEAQQAWQKWRNHVNLDDIDPASYRLLPLVYHNLQTLQVDDPLMVRLKGVYRHTWYKNQMLLRHAEQLISRLYEANIPAMFLKGAAMSVAYYPNNGTRFMSDVDIMVPPQLFMRTADIMFAQNWQLELFPKEMLYWYYQHQFTHAFAFQKDRFEIDLHYRLLPFVPQDEMAYWETAVSQAWRGQTIHLLNPTDQLFHTCCHGLRWGYGYLSWIPDALFILKNREVSIDWDYLVQHARQTRLILYMRNALACLAGQFQASIPVGVLQALNESPVSRAEDLEYNGLGRELITLPDLAKYHLIRVSRYKLFDRPMGEPVQLSFTGVFHYFAIKWHLEHWWQWPAQFIKKFSKNLKQRHLQHYFAKRKQQDISDLPSLGDR